MDIAVLRSQGINAIRPKVDVADEAGVGNVEDGERSEVGGGGE